MKVVRDDCTRVDAAERFVAEARVTGQLEHPNIVPVHELGTDRHGRPFYTMKRVNGVTLRAVRERLAAGDADAVARFPLGSLLTAFQKVCDAVAFAHSPRHHPPRPQAGERHDGGFGEVLVMDWGLAKQVGPGAGGDTGAGVGASGNGGGPGNGAAPESQESPPDAPPHARSPHAASSIITPSPRTLDGVVAGTPSFMAPEQAAGRVGEIDARTDVFALGAILYTLLALRPPFEGCTAAEVLERLNRGEVVPPAGPGAGPGGGLRPAGRGEAAPPGPPCRTCPAGGCRVPVGRGDAGDGL